MVRQGIDVVLKVGDKVVGGQQNITLTRQAASIDITNKINGTWGESLQGLKTWSLDCSGIYLVDDEAYDLMDDCFLSSQPIEVIVVAGEHSYAGKALITDFPLASVYNSQFKYSIKLLGDGELKKQ